MQAERLQEGHATRRALEETLNQVCTEILCLSHVHYIFNPLHFRSPESWKYRNGSVSDDKWQALARAWVSHPLVPLITCVLVTQSCPKLLTAESFSNKHPALCSHDQCSIHLEPRV